jgi:homoserine acetyltransferase
LLLISPFCQVHSDLFKGDFPKALAAIKAKAIVMPASTDLYFPPEDNAFEVKHMPNAELQVVDRYGVISPAGRGPALKMWRRWMRLCASCLRAEAVATQLL